MESRDLVSVSRLISRPIFASLGLGSFRPRLGLENCMPQSQARCLRLWILQRYGLGKFLWLNVYLSGVPAGEKQLKQTGEMPEIRNHFNFDMVTTSGVFKGRRARHLPRASPFLCPPVRCYARKCFLFLMKNLLFTHIMYYKADHK